MPSCVWGVVVHVLDLLMLLTSYPKYSKLNVGTTIALRFIKLRVKRSFVSLHSTVSADHWSNIMKNG